MFFIRTVIQPGISHPDIQLLHPINLEFSVNRNLAASWYHKVPVVEIKGHLESMNVSMRVQRNLYYQNLDSEDFRSVNPNEIRNFLLIDGRKISV